MDHLVQIPQVGSAWEPIPEPWVTLGMLAGLNTGFAPRHPRDAGDLPPGRHHRERLDALEASIETMRALWAKGTKGYHGQLVDLPETASYPRPVGDVPVIVGGAGERRTLRIAARLGDGRNVPADLETVDRRRQVLRGHCAELGRDPDEVAVTVHDLPVVGRDREDAWARVERLRGRSSTASYARRHHAGTPQQHRDRLQTLAEHGVDTGFVVLPDLEGPDDLLAVAPMLR